MKRCGVLMDLAQAGVLLGFAELGFALGWDLEAEIFIRDGQGSWHGVGGGHTKGSQGTLRPGGSWLCQCCLQPWRGSSTI